jgi:DNA-binding response OmpR family regulator
VPVYWDSNAPIEDGERVSTILLIEDDDLFRAGAAHHLRAAGLTVVEGSDFSQALRVLDASTEVDLVLTDIRLPGMHGFALARMARHRRTGVPVMYVTAFPEIDPAEVANAYGKILKKPIGFPELVEEVKSALAVSPPLRTV